MPGRDRTGPTGQGMGTGRRRGACLTGGGNETNKPGRTAGNAVSRADGFRGSGRGNCCAQSSDTSYTRSK